ncbi:MAG: hypothetical protein AABW63_02245 [Nanoarchaeota archaeon]
MKNLNTQLNNFLTEERLFSQKFRRISKQIVKSSAVLGVISIGVCSLMGGNYASGLLHSGKTEQEARQKIEDVWASQTGGRICYCLGKPGEELAYFVYGENKK